MCSWHEILMSHKQLTIIHIWFDSFSSVQIFSIKLYHNITKPGFIILTQTAQLLNGSFAACPILIVTNPIADVAISKRNQPLNKIFFFFFFYPHYIQEISKVVCKKSLSCNMPTKLDTIVCNQHALVITACTCFIQHKPDKEFSCKQLCWFPWYGGKKTSTFHLVNGGICN